MKKPSLHRYAWLSDQYLRKTGISTKYYVNLETKYMLIDKMLTDQLINEIKTLILQGASSIASRILFIAANLNTFTSKNIEELIIYSRRLPEILSIPVPPWADTGRIIDLVSSNEQIRIFLGSFTTAWIIKGLTYYLKSMSINLEYIICAEEYRDYINSSNVYRFFERDKRHEIVIIKCSNPREILSILQSNNAYVLSLNYLSILTALDHINELNNASNTLLLFNPSNTPLEKVFNNKKQIIISVEDLINIFK